MSWIRIAWRNLLAKPLSTGLSTILLAFGVGLVSLLMLTERQLDQAFRRNIEDIDLVLGAKGSPLQLILANVYHIDAPTGNIRLSDARQVMTHPYIEKAIPLAYGDNFQRYRIVGTEPSYPAHYGMQLQRPRPGGRNRRPRRPRLQGGGHLRGGAVRRRPTPPLQHRVHLGRARKTGDGTSGIVPPSR
jgi:putative ABC transport system permease protein